MMIAILLLSAKEPKDIHNEHPAVIAKVTESIQLSAASSVYRYAPHTHTHTHTHLHTMSCIHVYIYTQTHTRTCTHIRTHSLT